MKKTAIAVALLGLSAPTLADLCKSKTAYTFGTGDCYEVDLAPWGKRSQALGSWVTNNLGREVVSCRSTGGDCLGSDGPDGGESDGAGAAGGTGAGSGTSGSAGGASSNGGGQGSGNSGAGPSGSGGNSGDSGEGNGGPAGCD